MKKSYVIWVGLVLLLAVPAAAQIGYIGGKNKIRYDTFDWKVYETPHFRISYYDRAEPSLDEVASFAESAYDELARRLNFQILKPIPMLIYATHAEFEQTNVMVGFIPEGVGAFATPSRNRMVLPVDLPKLELQALIQHELGHIFQYEILYQGRRGRAFYKRPPLWYMEGMASYLGNDENSLDEAWMRDAALSDSVPSLEQPVSGFLAYRFGHMVFEFIESEWGEDGLRDFIFAFRNTMSGNVSRPLGRVFKMTVEEFDAEFRTWLRHRYKDYNLRGTPREFGSIFYAGVQRRTAEASPVASPNGDLVAAFTTAKDEIDVAVFGVPDRKIFKNLTKGYTTKYRYPIAQGLTVGPNMGRDLAFSPDGAQVAVFVRSEGSRRLLLLDVYKEKIRETIELPPELGQLAQPAWSPDGRFIAFHAVENGLYDIYQLDLDDRSVTNLTENDAFDGAPAYSPDGERLVFTTQEGTEAKLGEINLKTGERRQITFGPGSDDGAAFSRDGKRLYFASDREQGVWDIYFFDFEDDSLHRLTHVIGAALNPTPVETLEGEKVVYQGLSRGLWKLYVADPNQAVEVGELKQPKLGLDLEDFMPAVTLSVDPSRGQKAKRGFFLDDLSVNVGFDQDGYITSYTYLIFSDHYGDRRLSIALNSIDTFSNFRVAWTNMEKRLNWGVIGYDDRSFYITGYDPLREQFTEREQLFRRTGVSLFGQYPLSTYYRLEGGIGIEDRKAELPYQTSDGLVVLSSEDWVPLLSFGVTGDTTKFNYYGPHQGSRWRVRMFYGYDLDEGGSLYRDFQFEWRKYIAISRRQEFGIRFYGVMSNGNRPNVYAIGGYDTLRGYSTRGIPGNRNALVNVEYRFPLIDRLDLAFMHLGEVRGRIFADIGAAWSVYDGEEYNMFGQPGFQFYGEKTLEDGTVVCEDDRLCDGLASYGFGITARIFGVPMHWDFVRKWDLKNSIGGTETQFWIGIRY